MTEVEVRDYLAIVIGDIVSSGFPMGRLAEEFNQLVEGFDVPGQWYQPDELLKRRIGEYITWCSTRAGENPGQLMEELALLAFRCLKGRKSLKSYQSYAAQHDLVVSGSEGLWPSIISYLHLPEHGRTILIEAKNEDSPLNDSQLSRVASIMENKFETQCHLGVFFTRSGATGFPKPSGDAGKEDRRRRQRSLRDARATQAIFHARTRKFIVVLDDSDIRTLGENGSLPRILEAKIRDVEEATGLTVSFEDNWYEIDLPPHLRQYLSPEDFTDKDV